MVLLLLSMNTADAGRYQLNSGSTVWTGDGYSDSNARANVSPTASDTGGVLVTLDLGRMRAGTRAKVLAEESVTITCNVAYNVAKPHLLDAAETEFDLYSTVSLSGTTSRSDFAAVAPADLDAEYEDELVESLSSGLYAYSFDLSIPEDASEDTWIAVFWGGESYAEHNGRGSASAAVNTFLKYCVMEW
ncbi:MAG: hypothetical protein GY913_16330 [Proteobacteria bacterium]|nr:hypothetical protein [Pseudomonadota bacterium]